MHNGPVFGQADTGDNFIFPIQSQRLFLFVEKRIDEVEQIARIKLRRITRQTTRHIIMRNQLDAFMVCHLAGFRQFAIAALLDCQINQNRPRLHAFEHFLGYQFRCRTARDQRRANDDILFGDMLGYQCGLAFLIIGAHFFGVTAVGFAAFAFIGFDHHKCAAEAFDLLGSSAAHIRGRHNSAEAFGGRNGLQSRNTGPHDKHTRSRNSPGSRHHHRQGATIFRGRIQHGFITGQIGLRGQHIH